MQVAVWPGCRYVALRMVCTAMPRSSNACKKRATPAGTWKYADPSSSTGTLPITNLPGSSSVIPMLRRIHSRMSLGWNAHQAQLLDRAARNAGEPLIHIGHQQTRVRTLVRVSLGKQSAEDSAVVGSATDPYC